VSELQYSYYPGCSLHASAGEYDLSTRELFAALGIKLTEIPDWFCCGATPAHNVDELLSLSLCAKNLELAEQVEGDVAVACAACFSRLKFTQHILEENETKRKQVEQAIAAPVHLNGTVKHLLEILARDLGLDRLAKSVKKPLSGLKVACYYGCLLTRPNDVPNLDCVEAPTIMESVVEAAGAQTVAWSHRLESLPVPTLPCPVPVWCCSCPTPFLIRPRRPALTASWWAVPCAMAIWISARRRSRGSTIPSTVCRFFI